MKTATRTASDTHQWPRALRVRVCAQPPHACASRAKLSGCSETAVAPASSSGPLLAVERAQAVHAGVPMVPEAYGARCETEHSYGTGRARLTRAHERRGAHNSRFDHPTLAWQHMALSVIMPVAGRVCQEAEMVTANRPYPRSTLSPLEKWRSADLRERRRCFHSNNRNAWSLAVAELMRMSCMHLSSTFDACCS